MHFVLICKCSYHNAKKGILNGLFLHYYDIHISKEEASIP